ncbi:MAG: SBBP repeat-containing protein [Pyrinomonadaceae bacterium]
MLFALVAMVGVWFAGLAPARSLPVLKKTDRGEIAKENRGVGHLKKGGFPVLFEENKGQTDRRARFVSRQREYTAFFDEKGVGFSIKQHSPESADGSKTASSGLRKTDAASESIRMTFKGAADKAFVRGEDEAVTKTNYYIGRKRFVGLSNYKKVKYAELYKGVDAVFYGDSSGRLEYDFIVAPNADPNQIVVSFEGGKEVSIDERGDLVIRTNETEIVQKRPFAYQVRKGKKEQVSSRWIRSANGFQIELGGYQKSLPLTIDPVIGYLSYIGGTRGDAVDAVKADAEGNAYITGPTNSIDYPQPGSRTQNDFAVFVSKVSRDGREILYTTFLDGSFNDGVSGFEIGFKGMDIAIDDSGNAYVAGLTDSDDFPVSENAFQRRRGCKRQFGTCILGEEAFVTKLDNEGTIVYSTYLGGRDTDFANGIAVDSSGRAYVTGATSSGITFPKKNEFQNTGVFGYETNAFLAVLNENGTDLVYSSGLGGNATDVGTDIDLDRDGFAYITGSTESVDSFPIRSGIQNVNAGRKDTFIAKFNTARSGDSSLVYSTLLGGAGTDVALAIVVNTAGEAHIAGFTGSPDFPLRGELRSVNQVNEAFVSVVGAAGNVLINSTFIGGSNEEIARSIEVDASGTIFVGGDTSSADFPTSQSIQQTFGGLSDGFVTKFSFGNREISFSTFLGGTGFELLQGIDVSGKQIFVAGLSDSSDLPTTDGVFGENHFGGDDGFLAKIVENRFDSVGVFVPDSTFTLTQSITDVQAANATFTSGMSGERGVSGDWDGDGTDTIGSFTNGVWKIRNTNFPVIGLPAPLGFKTVNYGAAGDLPVAGDWNADGIDTPGVFRPSTGQFLLTNSTEIDPSVDITVAFGTNGDLPIAGDWDGDGIDTVGVYRPSETTFFFTNDNVLKASIDDVAFLGIAEDLPFAGDFDGDGVDTIGTWRPSTREFFITNDNVNVIASFVFGGAGGQPIVGDWDGLP